MKVATRAWTYAGVLLIVVGCVLLAVAWGGAAGETQVALQVPYLLSAGLPGVGLVIVGVGMVVIGVRETDARVRRKQQADLVDLLTALRDEIRTSHPVPPVRQRRTRRVTE